MPQLRNTMRSFPSSNWANYSLSLRWHCALTIMERYHSIPTSHIASLTSYWVKRIKELVSASSDSLHLVEVDYAEPDGDENSPYQNEMLGDENGIISFAVKVTSNGSRRFLTFEENKKFFELMTTTGASVVMLGQPVKLSPKLTVLRIALGADMIVNCLYGKTNPVDILVRINSMLEEDAALVDKIVSLALDWEGQSATNLNVTQSRMNELEAAFTSPQNSFPSQIIIHPSQSAAITLPQISAVLQAYLASSSLPNVALFFDIDAVDCAIRSLNKNLRLPPDANCNLLHCFAMKSCPISYIVYRFIHAGYGMEAASIMEVKHALALGCNPRKVMFDSPCKTVEELKFGIHAGVHINVNSLTELMKIATLLDGNKTCNGEKCTATFGLRVNPLVGAGEIDSLSTSTISSKFGIAYAEDDTAILQLFKLFPFLTAVMCHVGSQGMSLSSLTAGAAAVFRYYFLPHSLCFQSLLFFTIFTLLSIFNYLR